MVLWWVPFYSTSKKKKKKAPNSLFCDFTLEWWDASLFLCLPRKRNCTRASEAADCFPFVSLWMMASI